MTDVTTHTYTCTPHLQVGRPVTNPSPQSSAISGEALSTAFSSISVGQSLRWWSAWTRGPPAAPSSRGYISLWAGGAHARQYHPRSPRHLDCEELAPGTTHTACYAPPSLWRRATRSPPPASPGRQDARAPGARGRAGGAGLGLRGPPLQGDAARRRGGELVKDAVEGEDDGLAWIAKAPEARCLVLQHLGWQRTGAWSAGQRARGREAERQRDRETETGVRARVRVRAGGWAGVCA